MSVAEKLTTIAENEQRVFDSGYSKAESNMWDNITNFNNRTFYEYGFKFWGSESFNPPYKITPTGRNLAMFEDAAKIKKIESAYLDLSNVTVNNSADSTSCNYTTFRRCRSLEEIEDVGLPAGGYYQTFGWCSNLHTVAVMRCKKEGGYTNPFSSCSELRNITIDGVIGKNFTMMHCPLLTIESLRSIISALYDFVGNGETTTQTLTLHADAKARLTADDVKAITDKGWTLV
jgi:hypothetical protein